MIRKLLNRVPFVWKFGITIFLVIMSFFLGFYLFSLKLSSVLDLAYQIDLPIIKTFRKDFIRYFLLTVLLSGLFLLAIYFDINYYLKKINKSLLYAVTKKRLAVGLEEYETGDIFEDITENTNALFALFRNFDNMKSARVSTEATTMKMLMNNISEGIIMVNRDKVVTHINHQAENILRLMTGRILGHTISRGVTNPEFIESLEQTLEKDQRITDKEIVLNEAEPFNLTILPVKNKFGELMRALMILEKQTVKEEEEKVEEVEAPKKASENYLNNKE